MIKHHCYYLFHHIITVATTWVQHLSTWHKLGKWNQLKGAMMRWCMSIMMLRHRAKLKLPCNLNSGSVWPMQEFCMPYISLSCDCDLFIQSGILVSCLLDISFNVKIYRGWGCIVNCFMLSSLPCFYAIADLISLHLVTFLIFLILVHVTFLSSRCMQVCPHRLP